MGAYDPNFGIPVCTKFRPTVLKGRLCYQVDVNEFMNQVDRKKLMSHGLAFMLDYNEDRMGLDRTTILGKASLNKTKYFYGIILNGPNYGDNFY